MIFKSLWGGKLFEVARLPRQPAAPDTLGSQSQRGKGPRPKFDSRFSVKTTKKYARFYALKENYEKLDKRRKRK